jgi:hypothetical protein
MNNKDQKFYIFVYSAAIILFITTLTVRLVTAIKEY